MFVTLIVWCRMVTCGTIINFIFVETEGVHEFCVAFTKYSKGGFFLYL